MDKINDFCEKLGSTSPTPGGGAAAGITLSMGAACTEKALRFSIKENTDVLALPFADLRNAGLKLSIDDQSAFSNWQEAKKLPKNTEEEIRNRNDKINQYTVECIMVPYNICKYSIELADAVRDFIPKCSKWLLSDAQIGLIFAKASFDAGILNIDINLPYLKDKSLLDEIINFKKENINYINDMIKKVLG
jgi:methenyltetrahydrofolate cyclohydrolase